MKTALLILAVFFFSSAFPGGDAFSAPAVSPDILSCTTEAKASGDYRFNKKRWLQKNGDYFKVGTQADPNGLQLRNKIFANLNSKTPIVRSVTEEGGLEFNALMLQKTPNEAYMVWSSTPFDNKIWTAAINTETRRAVVTQVYSGTDSIGTDAELLSCE
jgi:hypothetical protein